MFVWIDAYVTERGPTTMTDLEAQSIASESVQSECGTHVRVCSAQCCVSQWLGLFGRALALKDSFLIITWIYNKHFHYFLPNAITHSPIRHITFVRHCLLWHCLVWYCRLALSRLALSRLALSRLALPRLALCRFAHSRLEVSAPLPVQSRPISMKFSVTVLGCWYIGLQGTVAASPPIGVA